MLKYVFITGGNTKIKGLSNRIHRELRMLTDVDDKINMIHRYSTNYLPQKMVSDKESLKYKDDSSLDAWRGAAKFANDKLAGKHMDQHVITKAIYEECGSNYL